MPTKIEWARNPDGTRGETWNPVTGCSPVSEGCEHCYAARMAKRLAGRFGYPADEPFRVTLHPERLDEPLHWKKPRRVFVVSMGDLFHEQVPFGFIREIFEVMERTPRHTYQVLTKRPARMLEFVEWLQGSCGDWLIGLPNVWLGVTAENQRQANERIPVLLEMPAAVRFVSLEPMLGPVDLMSYLANNSMWKASQWNHSGLSHAEEQADGHSLVAFSKDGTRYEDGVDLHWVICGAETGPGKRPMLLDWARTIRNDCQRADVPFFFKKDSSGSRLLDGREYNEFPEVHP